MPTGTKPEPFHPDLRLARWLPLVSAGPRTLWMFRLSPPGIRPVADMSVDTVPFAGPAGDMLYRVFRPVESTRPTPALLWIHGGGLILGTPEQDDASNLALARNLGITVLSAAYRLAPDHPAPAALDDLAAGFRQLVARADELGIDPTRIAIGGASAGGGLAAGLAQRLRDEGGTQPVFQLLVYPMLDDRTVLRDDIDQRHLRMWSAESNRYAWSAYLGTDAGAPGIPSSFVPARREDLSGLPPAWIGVGTLDLFHDEDVAYARRLEEAGVLCELNVVPGAFHGFDAVFRNAGVTRAFHADWERVLRAAFRQAGPA
ncbi:alpha/beta hydrolase [Microbacterium sp. HD4P20]|uniref:alpha/beta hydrolase fold domain-containing protein n=1 Tax=Microbacterium sp. HD4P20 TaxID=2864874 RepID=UPI001C643694|nr:alpha/beta hydrolase fold domain-containing protein [Microbacterium sp. HD4P20]MCP2636489.1 alpha/beta hydrolase [Microbacterium sp. HD4P20]